MATELLTKVIESPQDILTSDQAAEYLGIRRQTLEVWRCTRRVNIPYHKIGRCVRYRRADLDRYLDAHRVGGDSESANA